MAKRNQNPRLAKVHRCYKIDEIADLYGTHKNTVLNWIKQGLPTLDSKRPLMVLGYELKTFHAKRKVQNKQPCKQNEIFCMKCKTPKVPVIGMVEYHPVTAKTGNIIGICPICETLMYRRISVVKILQFSAQIGFTLPQAHPHIVDSF